MGSDQAGRNEKTSALRSYLDKVLHDLEECCLLLQINEEMSKDKEEAFGNA